MSNPKYTFYIVSQAIDHHYPVLMSNNGKVALNEPVGRAAKLEHSAQRFVNAAEAGEVAVVRISEADFRAKFPKFAPNKGGKKKAAKDAPKEVFKKGDKVNVKAGVWGICKAVVLKKGRFDHWQLRITHGPHKGHDGSWSKQDITKA